MQYENKKKGLKKQLFAAIVMLLVAALALGSATYAWFANSKTVEANGMKVNAQADSSLQISKDKESWGSSAAVDGIESVTTMKPSTSYDGKNFGYLSDNVKVASESNAAASWNGEGGKLGAEDLVLASKKGTYYAEGVVYLKSNEKCNVNVEHESFTLTTADSTTNALKPAVRVSVSITEEGKTETAPKSYNAGGGSVIAATTTGGGVGKYSSSSTPKWSLVAPAYTTTSSNTWTFTANTIYKAVVRVWFEGQDTSCTTSNISVNDISIKFNFARGDKID